MKTVPGADQPVVGKKPFLLNRAFGLLWLGQTVSQTGSFITEGALQIVAVLALGATPLQMGLFALVTFVPAFVVAPLAGVWVDRLSHRPVLVLADCARAVLLLTIPLAALLHVLSLVQLYLVMLLTATLGVFFTLAYRAFLPALLSPDELLEGNSKVSASEALAEVVGPSIAGLLVQAITAPLAILFDALSFLFSACCIGVIRVQEPERPVQPSHFWWELYAGWQLLLRHKTLRRLATCLTCWSFCGGSFVALYTIYVIRILKFSPLIYGLLGAAAGAGALLGSLLMPRFSRYSGSGLLLAGAVFVHGSMALLTPLLGSQQLPVVLLLLGSQVAGGVGGAIYLISDLSLRQKLVPQAFLGRVNASMSFLGAGATLAGSLLAGLLSAQIGVRITLLAGACGMALSSLWLLFSGSGYHLAEEEQERVGCEL